MITTEFVLPRSNYDICINETFEPGITGIFGPSGSGKSSLLNAIAGLVIPEQGRIVIHGREVFNAAKRISLPVHKRNIGYVFQNGRLFSHMSVKKNLMYGIDKKRPEKLGFNEVVAILKLQNLLNSRPAAVSGGEYQRVALGRALLSSPDILLLDEPFSAVDTNLRSQIIPYLLTLQQMANIPILVVSHEIEDLLKLTNRLCIIEDGKCVGHDEYDNLIASKSAAAILNSGRIFNTSTLRVNDVDHVKNLATLSYVKNNNCVRVVCERCRLLYRVGDEVKIFIKSDDIALSRSRVEDSTFQNQLEGTVIDIFDRGSTVFCLVDTGIKLMAEITRDSKDRLELKPGSRVWCLFKSIAIDVVP